MTNIATFLGLLDVEIALPEQPVVWLDRAEKVRVTASGNGLFMHQADLATTDPVQAGQVIGTLLGDEDLAVTPIHAQVTGFLYEYGCSRAHADVALPAQHPYASRGDRLATIACPK